MDIWRIITWKRFWNTYSLAISSIIVAIAVFTIGYIVLQHHFIYLPQREINATPDVIGLPYEKVDFETSDGVRLAGWFIPFERPRGVILMCHGNAGNISHMLEYIYLLNQLDFSVFVFDYRGYGESKGWPTEQGTYLDADAAWQYLVRDRKISPDKITVFGRSLGGTIAVWLARHHTPKALILESSFASTKGVASILFPIFPTKLVTYFNNYDATRYLPYINSPILVIHSRDDDIIPFKEGLKLFKSANEPKELLEVSGTHNSVLKESGVSYIKGLKTFINKYIAE